MLIKIIIENIIRRGYKILFVFFACLGFAYIEVNANEMLSTQRMKLIAGGAFIMGSNDGLDDEKPQHTVLLKPFFLDTFPVSNADLAKFLNIQGLRNQQGESFYDFQDSDARIHRHNSVWQADLHYELHPVNEVSWVGARDYCSWLNKRLPTEAEWEKAALGNDGRKYPWGNAVPNAKLALFGAPYNSSAPVDAFPGGASPYGILDMAGNQWEWVSSVYQPYPYKADDGRESLNTGPIRSTRGGGHDSNAGEISASHRGQFLSRNPKAGHHNIGFRCASNYQ